MNHSERKQKLAGSKFRSRFRLVPADIVYIRKTGWERIEQHTQDFIRDRLASAQPQNDGKQTPYRGHPVFKAQHATATCCRGCLQKWYGIPKGRMLNEEEKKRVQTVILDWIHERFSEAVLNNPPQLELLEGSE